MATILGAGQELVNEWRRPWSHRFVDAGTATLHIATLSSALESYRVLSQSVSKL